MRFILAILIVFFSTNCFAFWTKGTDTAPEVQTFCKRVLDDGGTVIDIEYMDKTVKLLKQLGVWSNVKFLGDANFAVKLNSGVSVTKLYDLSGNNNDTVQATVGFQPVWTAGVQNGKYGIVFDGTDDVLSAGNVAVLDFERTDKFTILAGVKSPVGYIIGKQGATNPWQGYSLSVNSGKIATQLYVEPQAISVDTVSATWADGNYHLVIETFDGSSIAAGVLFYGDGSLQAKNAPIQDNLASSIKNSNSFTIGRRGGTGAIYTGTVSISCVLNVVLTTTQRTAIETYLNSYFSIY